MAVVATACSSTPPSRPEIDSSAAAAGAVTPAPSTPAAARLATGRRTASAPQRTYAGRVVITRCPSPAAVSGLIGTEMYLRPVDVNYAPQVRCTYLPVGVDAAMNALVHVTFIHISNNGTTPDMVYADEKDCDGKPHSHGAVVVTCHRSATPELGPGTYRYVKVSTISGVTGSTDCHLLLTDVDGAPLYVSGFTVASDGSNTYSGDMSEVAVCGWLERIVELAM
jgi:hypothetical protein